MKYLKITNKGEVDVEAFTLLGASTKRNDSQKIGMFGSGNKYAIAYLLRNNYEIIAYSGNKKIEFKTIKKEFKDNIFDVLIINDIETSITIQMGHKWKLWQAIRELYSNAIDEGLLFFDIVEDLQNTKSDETTIYISLKDELYEMFIDIDEYILRNREPIFSNKYGSVYNKTGINARIYRKGIKVFETDKKSLFDYDLYDIDIDEDRMAKYYWQPIESIWNLLFTSNNNYIIRKILENINDDYLIENSYGCSNAKESNISETWEYVLNGKQVFPKTLAGWLSNEELMKTILLPQWLYSAFISRFGDKLKPKSLMFSTNGLIYDEVELNNLRTSILSEVFDFLHDANYRIEYEIKIVDFKKEDILGSINREKNQILIDVKCLDKGVDETINTIIEEYIHIKYGVADETRGFQTSIITEFINYMKLKVKVL